MAATSSLDALVDDTERLQALQRYGILDTPMEPAYDELADIAGHVCEAPVALVSFVDRDRQWFKSAQGLPDRETPLDQSVCRYAIRQPDVFIVPDLAQDVRFAHYGIVTQKHPLRFYAGAPLVTPDGYALGTCACWTTGRASCRRVRRSCSAPWRARWSRLLELHRANDRQGQMLAELDAARQQMAVLDPHRCADRAGQPPVLYRTPAPGAGPAAAGQRTRLPADDGPGPLQAHQRRAWPPCGDQALQLFADLCRSVFRASDVVGRWGGEEFLALLPATGLEQAQAVAQRVHAALAEQPLPGIEPPHRPVGQHGADAV